MRRLLALTILCVLGCDNSDSGLVDARDDGDGGGDPTDALMAGPKTIKLTLTNRPTNAANFSFLVAYQDGSAAWVLAPAPMGDTYSFSVNAPSYGVAYACIGTVAGTTPTSVRTVTSAHFAVGERTDLTLDVPSRCSDRAPMNVTLSGTVTNRPLSGVLVVSFGSRTAFIGSQSGSFTLQTPPATHDLIVTHAVPLGNGEYYVDEALVQRSVALTGPATRTIDFAAAQNTDFYTVTANVPNARIIASTTLYTANGTTVGFVRESANWESDALAASQRIPTDVYDQSIAVSTVGQGATITNATNAPGAQTYVAPAPLGTPMTTTPSKTPYVTLQTTWPAYANAIGYTWNAIQQLTGTACGTNAACTIVWTASISPGVTGMMPGYRMPDLAGLIGWKSSYELASGVQTVGNVTAITSTAGASDFPTGIPANGTKRAFVRADYGLTP